jgi:hypothetical protein
VAAGLGVNTNEIEVLMERFEKIAALENEIEALCLTDELEDRGIPHLIQSKYDLAYDGLFQFSAGWGHVEAPAQHRDAIIEILKEIRCRPAPTDEETEE